MPRIRVLAIVRPMAPAMQQQGSVSVTKSTMVLIVPRDSAQ